MKMFLDQRRPYNKFTAWLNGEYLLDSTGSNNKSVIGFWSTKVNALIFKKQLHDKIFNELAPARLLIELAFGSSNKQSFSGARPLNYNMRCREWKYAIKHNNYLPLALNYSWN